MKKMIFWPLEFYARLDRRLGRLLPICAMAALMLSCSDAKADDIQNLKSWILTQPIKVGTAVNMRGEMVGVSYLSIISVGQAGFGAGDGGALEYASFNAGADFNGDRTKVLLIPMLRPHNVGAKIWSLLPAGIPSHFRRLILPDIEMGIGANLPGKGPWIIGNDVRAVVAYRF